MKQCIYTQDKGLMPMLIKEANKMNNYIVVAEEIQIGKFTDSF